MRGVRCAGHSNTGDLTGVTVVVAARAAELGSLTGAASQAGEAMRISQEHAAQGTRVARRGAPVRALTGRERNKVAGAMRKEGVPLPATGGGHPSVDGSKREQSHLGRLAREGLASQVGDGAH